jgi:hypothetical protein
MLVCVMKLFSPHSYYVFFARIIRNKPVYFIYIKGLNALSTSTVEVMLLISYWFVLSDIFPFTNSLKQGDALSPLILNFSLEYAIRSVQINQEGW